MAALLGLSVLLVFIPVILRLDKLTRPWVVASMWMTLAGAIGALAYVFFYDISSGALFTMCFGFFWSYACKKDLRSGT